MPTKNLFSNNVHSIQEVVTIGYTARRMPKINAALKNRLADHQNSTVKIKGMIKIQPVSILIDPGGIFNNVSPRIVEICKLVPEKFEKSWLVQSGTCTKRKLTNYVKNYEILMNEFNMHADVNILPLGSYDMLIGMGWL